MFSKTLIEQFYNAQKQNGLLLLGAGLLCCLLALVFQYALKRNFLKGMVPPLLILGALMTLPGYLDYKNSDQLRIDRVYSFDMYPNKLRTEEVPFIRGMIDQRQYVMVMMIVLAAGSLILLIYFLMTNRETYRYGFALALLLLSGLMLLWVNLDLTREKNYLNLLNQWGIFHGN